MSYFIWEKTKNKRSILVITYLYNVRTFLMWCSSPKCGKSGWASWTPEQKKKRAITLQSIISNQHAHFQHVTSNPGSYTVLFHFYFPLFASCVMEMLSTVSVCIYMREKSCSSFLFFFTQNALGTISCSWHPNVSKLNTKIGNFWSFAPRGNVHLALQCTVTFYQI